MSEKVQRYARQYAKQHARKYVMDSRIQGIKNLMANENWTIERALDALGIKGEDRKYILNEIQTTQEEPAEAN